MVTTRQRHGFFVTVCASIAAVSIGLLVISGTARGTAAPTPLTPPPPFPTALRTPPRPALWTIVPPTIGARDGGAAIAPTLQTSDTSAATFTEQDARDRVARERPSAPIIGVTFLTVAQARSTFNLAMPFDANEPLCVVQVTENGTAPGTTKPYTTVLVVYSARTGNLLAESFR